MKHLAAGLLLFCWLPLWGQVTNLHFTNLSIDAGLSDKMVFAVAQDSTGLMWFGTAEGLNRYDGYNFETFRYNPGDSTSVSASFINCIHLTRTGELWIGTEKGLDLYDPVTESFVKYHADNDSLRLLNNLRIRCIHDDPQGVMWVGTLEGLIRLDLRKRYINYFVLVPDAFDRMANEIRSICADRHGMLWLGTFDGLYRFNPTDNSFVRYETRSRKLPNDTYNNLVNALYIPENTPDLLYVGSSSGLVVLDIRHPEQPLGTLRAEDGGLTDNDIKSILSYDDTHLLLATADGLTLYDTRSCQASAYYSSLSDPTSLPNNSLRTLFRDRQNIVWIGTDSGLAKLDLKRKKIDCVRLTNDRKGAERKVIVNDLLGPPDHSLWLTTNEGVLRYDSTRRDAGYTRYMADKGVSHSIAKRLIRDSHGTLWLGTNDGIDYYDAARDRFVRAEHSNQNFSLKYIYDIKEDADHDIVTNISSGLCFITPHYRPDGGISHLSYKTRLISGIINSDNCDIGYFDVDAKGNIWFAATQEGLFKYEKRNDRFIQYKVRTNDPRSLISNRIYTIHVDRKGNVWTGTDRGLCKLDPASGLFERFDNDLDLSQSIRTLTSDSRGRIWAATTNKLIMYDPVRKNKIVCDLNRDLRIDELIYNSFFIDPQGHIYMGGDGGYIRYHPDAILLNEDKAPTVVTSFSLWNKEVRPRHRIGKRVVLPRSILHSDRLRLRHNENSFRFYFSLLNFASSNNKYAYRLEGYDKEWQMTGGTQNYAAYSNLSPGRYLFTVRGCNSDGIWSDRTARIEVRILPPWWLSWWAYLIYGVLVAVVIVVAYNLTLTNETPLGTPARKTRTHEDRRTEPGQDAFLHQRIARIQNPAFAHPGPHREPRGTDPGQAPAGAALAHAAERRTAAAADRPDHGSAQVRQREDETQPQHGRVRVVRAQDLRIVRLPGATPGHRLRFRNLRTRAHLPIRQRQSREGAVQPAFQRLQVHARQRAYRHHDFAAPQRRRTVRRSRGVGHRDRRHGGRPGTYFRAVLPGQQSVVRVDPRHGHRADAR